jgi:ribonuclease Z
MRPILHPYLVNGPFGDPGLYVEFMFERRALLFDMGDLQPLSARKLLRVSHAFVSHTHMDHFMGFDRLLRICVGRDKDLHLYGPAGFIDQVGHKLAAYTWNLVHNYESDFALTVTEIVSPASARRAAFHVRSGFQRSDESTLTLHDGVLLDEDNLRVRTAVLDHLIPCLGFAVEEKRHVNVWRNRVEEMGLTPGPWLHALKRAVIHEQADDTPIAVPVAGGVREFTLGELKQCLLRIVDGQKIGYVVDVRYDAENARRITALVRDADTLFIESTFLQQDAAQAAAKYHLTASQAGRLARAAGAKRVIPFHFSPRYSDCEARVREEVTQAFSAG